MWTGNVYWIPKKNQKEFEDEDFLISKKIKKESRVSSSWRIYTYISSEPLLLRDKTDKTEPYEYMFAISISENNRMVLISQYAVVLDKLKEISPFSKVCRAANSVHYKVDDFVKFYSERYSVFLAAPENKSDVLSVKVLKTEAQIKEIGHDLDSISLSGKDLVTSKIFRETINVSFYTSVTLDFTDNKSVNLTIRNNGKILLSDISPSNFYYINQILSILMQHGFVVEDLL